MSNPILRRPWFIPGLLMIVLILSLAMRTGYGEQSKNVTTPTLEAQQRGGLAGAIQRLSAVAAAQDRHTAALLAVNGVVGTATAALPNGEYAIKVLTKFAGLETALPKELGGVPVVVEHVGEIRALDFTGQTFNPVLAGVSGGNAELDLGQLGLCASGTIGAVVTGGGRSFFLSNNHLFARSNRASLGEDIVHPGRADFSGCDLAQTHRVADLSAFREIRFLRQGEGSSLDVPNRIDAAIAEIRPGVNFSPMTACGYTPSSTVQAATVGLTVKKCGRTSMLTTGVVTGINATVVVDYSFNGFALFTGQILTTGMAAAGDSGSLLVTSVNNRPVGLLFAGSNSVSVHNPIGEVLTALGVTIAQ
jgi:hypothetical protein